MLLPFVIKEYVIALIGPSVSRIKAYVLAFFFLFFSFQARLNHSLVTLIPTRLRSSFFFNTLIASAAIIKGHINVHAMLVVKLKS